MKNKKMIKLKTALFVVAFLILSACNTTPAESVNTYNGFADFIPYIPGAFPDDFNLDGANIGILQEHEQDVYWEIYTGADGRFFLIFQRSLQDNLLPATDALTIQDWEARLGPLDSSPDIPALAEVEMSNASRLSMSAFTKSEIPILLEVISNASEADLIEFGEMLTPSICLSTPTPEQ